jgi:hypothetical protein
LLIGFKMVGIADDLLWLMFTLLNNFVVKYCRREAEDALPLVRSDGDETTDINALTSRAVVIIIIIVNKPYGTAIPRYLTL